MEGIEELVDKKLNPWLARNVRRVEVIGALQIPEIGADLARGAG